MSIEKRIASEDYVDSMIEELRQNIGNSNGDTNNNGLFSDLNNYNEQLIFDANFVFYDSLDKTSNSFISPFYKNQNEQCLIVWDDVRYICDFEVDDDEFIITGENTPFKLQGSNNGGIIYAIILEDHTAGDVHNCKVYRLIPEWEINNKLTMALQSNWDEEDMSSITYIHNKPCYRTETLYQIRKNANFMRREWVSGTIQTVLSSDSFQPIPGESYEIRIDNEIIDTLPCVITDSKYNWYGIGNNYLYSGKENEDTKQSVFIGINYNNNYNELQVICKDLEPGEHTVYIYGKTYKYIPIDDRYLPNTVPNIRTQTEVGSVVVVSETGNTAITHKIPIKYNAVNIESILPSPDWNKVINKPFSEEIDINNLIEIASYEDLSFSPYQSYYIYQSSGDFNDLLNYDNLIISWDGVDYQCVNLLSDDDSMKMFGNMAIAGMGAASTEPFVIQYMDDMMLIATTDSASTHDISFSTGDIIINTLNEKYIPDNIPKVDVASVGQTIVVKAIDANGKPIEWECVDMAAGGGSNVTVVTYDASTMKASMTGTEIAQIIKSGKVVVLFDGMKTSEFSIVERYTSGDDEYAVVCTSGLYPVIKGNVFSDTFTMASETTDPIFIDEDGNVIKKSSTTTIITPTSSDGNKILTAVGDYYGSTKWIDPSELLGVNSGLPEVTEADNGKILMVVDGVWQAVAIPNAEGGLF